MPKSLIAIVYGVGERLVRHFDASASIGIEILEFFKSLSASELEVFKNNVHLLQRLGTDNAEQNTHPADLLHLISKQRLDEAKHMLQLVETICHDSIDWAYVVDLDYETLNVYARAIVGSNANDLFNLCSFDLACLPSNVKFANTIEGEFAAVNDHYWDVESLDSDDIPESFDSMGDCEPKPEDCALCLKHSA